MGFRDSLGEQTIGRMAGTGTAVGGTGTSAVGCQLRWRFFGGPEFIADDTKHQKQMLTAVSKAKDLDPANILSCQREGAELTWTVP